MNKCDLILILIFECPRLERRYVSIVLIRKAIIALALYVLGVKNIDLKDQFQMVFGFKPRTFVGLIKSTSVFSKCLVYDIKIYNHKSFCSRFYSLKSSIKVDKKDSDSVCVALAQEKEVGIEPSLPDSTGIGKELAKTSLVLYDPSLFALEKTTSKATALPGPDNKSESKGIDSMSNDASISVFT